MLIAKCKGCGMYYPVKENEKGKKCPQCKSEAEELMDYPVYKKGLVKRITTIAGVTGMLMIIIGFCIDNFNVHWSLAFYGAGGILVGTVYALSIERMSLSDIATAIREDTDKR